jgi:oxygen-independent coproporphyrinogen-3 oxidase
MNLLAGIYLHIPFCRQACHYCDFHFSTNLKLRSEMIKAMDKEISLRRKYLNENIKTFYLGGGTPSILSESELEALFSSIHDNFHFSPGAEITLETNPDDISDEKLQFWKSMGINRLSIGIQTFNDGLLKYLNRIHTGKEALESVEKARRHGFDNLSIDLIYALPAEDHDIWKNDVKTAITLLPEHISAYNLTIEPKTVFGNWLQKGKITEMDEDYATKQYLHLCDSLRSAGYEHYEVSNYALPGFYSKHNTSYWQGIPYIGIGPGAHSYNGASRQSNLSNNSLYIKELHNEKIPAKYEELSTEEQVHEYLITGLRASGGIDLQYLKEKFNYKLSSSGDKMIDQLLERNLAELTGSKFILNEKGFLLADHVALVLSI